MPESQPSQPCRVLIAEDNVGNLNAAQAYLEAMGYEVATAGDGETAVQRVLELKPEVVLMDIQMPGTNGLEATRRIRSHPDTRHIPVLALTALAMAGDEERCRAAGADDYLSKPVNFRQLVGRIEKLRHRNKSPNQPPSHESE